MVEKGNGRRRGDPTPEEIQDECRKIRKGWSSGERILRRARCKKHRWRLPKIHLDEVDEDKPADDQDTG